MIESLLFGQVSLNVVEFFVEADSGTDQKVMSARACPDDRSDGLDEG